MMELFLFGHLMILTANYICLFVRNPKTDGREHEAFWLLPVWLWGTWEVKRFLLKSHYQKILLLWWKVVRSPINATMLKAHLPKWFWADQIHIPNSLIFLMCFTYHLVPTFHIFLFNKTMEQNLYLSKILSWSSCFFFYQDYISRCQTLLLEVEFCSM